MHSVRSIALRVLGWILMTSVNYPQFMVEHYRGHHVRVATHDDPARSATIVSFQPASLDVRKLHQALYERDRIVCATRGGTDRPGLRFAPHFYNLQADVDRAVDAIARYARTGI